MKAEYLNTLDMPLYSYAEAAHLAQISVNTAKRWLRGYSYHNKQGQLIELPPVTPRHAAEANGGASFIDLIELVAIGRLKSFGFVLPQIRQIVENCQEMLATPRPLVSHKFKTDGREIFVHKADVLLEVFRKKGRQAWNEVLHPFLETLDYEEDLARRWWPLGRDVPVVVDPDYGFGLPVIKGSGIRTEIILERFRAGDLEREIAEDFNVTEMEVQRALQFEVRLAGKAA